MLTTLYWTTVVLSLLFVVYSLYETIHQILTEYSAEIRFSHAHPQMTGKIEWLKSIVTLIQLCLWCLIPIVNLIVSYSMTTEDFIYTTVQKGSDWFVDDFNSKLDKCGLWDEWLDNN